MNNTNNTPQHKKTHQKTANNPKRDTLHPMPETTTHNCGQCTPDRLLTLEEVAKALNLSTSRAQYLRRHGHPLLGQKAVQPGGKTGAKLAWKQSDLNDYIANLPYATPKETA